MSTQNYFAAVLNVLLIWLDIWQSLADEFYRNYNDTPYNSIEDHVCHLVYVARVDFLKESAVSVFYYYMYTTHT